MPVVGAAVATLAVAATLVAVAVVTLVVAAATEALARRGYRRAEIRRDIESNRISARTRPCQVLTCLMQLYDMRTR